MKKVIYTIAAVLTLMFTSCNTWLDVMPNNEQVTDDYWKSKEDVESVLASGYYYMRTCVPNFIKWGELRGGSIYTNVSGDSRLQDFNMTASTSLCNYENVYKIISMANSVIKYAPNVRTIDETYNEAIMNSHLSEAYFMRAYAYFILLKNYKEVPLIVEAYVNDEAEFDIAKSSEADIIAQIKADIETALSSGAAKTTYEESWQTKGRATKWALYALMADVCLWNAQVNAVDKDFDLCIQYCNEILNATDNFRPVMITNTNDWYTMFYPGNSNESIFELNWDKSTYNETNNFASLFTLTNSSTLQFTTRTTELMRQEITDVIANLQISTIEGRVGRMLLATCVPSASDISTWAMSPTYYLWKYYGTDIADISGGVRQNQDANFIIYRVAEIYLMKAEALIMKGNDSKKAALECINKVRNRAGLANYKNLDLTDSNAEAAISELTELELLQEVLAQREMEFAGEGKRWYDLLRFGRMQNYKYENEFIAYVLEGNQTTNAEWVKSVLQNRWAWYMPLPQADIDANSLLVQNPYYETTN